MFCLFVPNEELDMSMYKILYDDSDIFSTHRVVKEIMRKDNRLVPRMLINPGRKAHYLVLCHKGRGEGEDLPALIIENANNSKLSLKGRSAFLDGESSALYITDTSLDKIRLAHKKQFSPIEERIDAFTDRLIHSFNNEAMINICIRKMAAKSCPENEKFLLSLYHCRNRTIETLHMCQEKFVPDMTHYCTFRKAHKRVMAGGYKIPLHLSVQGRPLTKNVKEVETLEAYMKISSKMWEKLKEEVRK